MPRRLLHCFAALFTAALLSSCEALPEIADVLLEGGTETGLSNETISAGLREALVIGSDRVVDRLGAEDGFYGSEFRIPLPDRLQQVRDNADRFGLGGAFDSLEQRINRAAEAAAPQARDLFVGAITQMTFSDVMGIYKGPDDAATAYLRRSTENDLRQSMRPVISNSLDQVGAVRSFNDLVSRYNALPFVEPINADLSDHVLDYANNALFARLAIEEGAIRQDPVKRTTELLRTVFANR